MPYTRHRHTRVHARHRKIIHSLGPGRTFSLSLAWQLGDSLYEGGTLAGLVLHPAAGGLWTIVVYSVQCTVYSVQCTLYSVHCTLYTLHFAMTSLSRQRKDKPCSLKGEDMMKHCSGWKGWAPGLSLAGSWRQQKSFPHAHWILF